MKIAVIKLGARIVFGDNIGTSGGSGEARSIINMLLKAKAEVHVFTKINKNFNGFIYQKSDFTCF